MNELLKETNFLLYAAKHYDNPGCLDIAEFHEDLNRFKYLKRLFNKYIESGEIKERLILNHLIVLNNTFGVSPTTRMLFLKLKNYLPYIKPFLVYMNTLPEKLYNIEKDSAIINTVDIPLDDGIVKALRSIG